MISPAIILLVLTQNGIWKNRRKSIYLLIMSQEQWYENV